jgi:hypothetical protein
MGSLQHPNTSAVLFSVYSVSLWFTFFRRLGHADVARRQRQLQ